MSSTHIRIDQKSSPNARRSLIYFSSVPYDSYAQRPHFMVEAFTLNGFTSILWVDPYPTRFPEIADFRRLFQKKKKPSTKRPLKNVEVLQPMAFPIEPLPMSAAINHALVWRPIREKIQDFADHSEHCVIGVGRPSKLAEWALENVPHARSFIDVLDNFPAFYTGVSRISMRERLQSLSKKADDVYCSSSALSAEMKKLRGDAVTVLNGYLSSALPAAQGAQAKPRCIGYVGSIAKWFDWPLVISLANALPDTIIRLIGPEFVPRPSDLPPNIELIGKISQSEVTHYIQDFAVGLIPFLIDDLTAAVDPIKYYEYRCFGIPVWSTNFGEMEYRDIDDGVIHISMDSDWKTLWDQNIVRQLSNDELASFRKEISWSRRFEPIIARSLLQTGRSLSLPPNSRVLPAEK
ncbi:glycosyltransferase family protein [Diaphorobacter aerolatus]|uniref:Glycosyltransferase n=1 Tax=Diaphorobacter aerolatus TaxID=1288495 RepID=A0A7H0GK91_9BURK|nr:glycosyltransferase [Diaphorobacter aerolatus]QNP48707.1 glycosyltransferase [Diaphorobacter aerolatus]